MNFYEDFIRTNYKVVNRLWAIGEKEDANTLLAFTHDTASKLIGNRCPVCNKLLTDESEIEFLHSIGMCLGCDHVQLNVLEDRRTNE
jgi:hypothetical protein